MFETILVVLIIVAVFFASGRSIYRTITHQKTGQCCGGCNSCTLGSAKKEES